MLNIFRNIYLVTICQFASEEHLFHFFFKVGVISLLLSWIPCIFWMWTFYQMNRVQIFSLIPEILYSRCWFWLWLWRNFLCDPTRPISILLSVLLVPKFIAQINVIEIFLLGSFPVVSSFRILYLRIQAIWSCFIHACYEILIKIFCV